MNKETKKIVLTALFGAIGVVLKVFVSFQVTQTLRPMSVWPIPIMLAGYFLGPFYGIAAGFVTDTGYMLYKGEFWNLFSISAMLWGVAGHFIRKFKFKPYILGIGIIILLTSIIETSINTLQMYIWGMNIYADLLFRIIGLFLRVPLLAYLMLWLTRDLDKIIKI